MRRPLTLGLVTTLALFGFSALVYAQFPQQTTYLPMTEKALPTPTPEPSPTPLPDPPMSTTVIQPGEMPSQFYVDEFREVTNDEVANASVNPDAARAAFAQQGRQTSYFIRFLSDLGAPDAAGVTDQAVRYGDAGGALLGLNYGINYELSDPNAPGYREVTFTQFGDLTRALRRTFKSSGYTWIEYYVVVKQSRYIAIVQVLGLQNKLSIDNAAFYVTKAAARLPKAQ